MIKGTCKFNMTLYEKIIIHMKQTLIALICCIMVSIGNIHATNYHFNVRKIWENGSHCAFTSLVKFQDKYYCAFREGETHIFDKNGKAEGKVRLLLSKNGKRWKSVAVLSKPGYDLRDPKLSMTPDGKMMVTIGGSLYQEGKIIARIPHVSFSSDGVHFSDPEPVNIDSTVCSGFDWLWRVTWEGDTGYVIDYSCNGNESCINLMKTMDGKRYELVSPLTVSDFPNEATIRFTADKRMLVMLRRERGDRKGYWGVSDPPYKNWIWKKMDFSLGGPNFLLLDKEKVIAGSRNSSISRFPKMAIYAGDTAGNLEEVMVLPSGGDSGYPGMLIVKNQLWISYYSSHETANASIYLARIPLKMVKGYSNGLKKQ